MKLLLIQVAILLALCSCSKTDQNRRAVQEINDTSEVQNKLTQFEKGRITLNDLTEDATFAKQLMSYYTLHSNELSLKMKLPISRCFGMAGDSKQAAALALEYVRVYSNDWRGWRILASASITLQDLPQALNAYTNATRLGDDGSYCPLAFVALQLDRLDVVHELVPRLLDLKSRPTQDVEPLEIVGALVIF